MAQIIINSTTGVLPLDVWVCDLCDETAVCTYLQTVTTLPTTVTVPPTYDSYPSYSIKFIDDLGCEFCETISSNVEFMNGDNFEFMDGVNYEFQ